MRDVINSTGTVLNHIQYDSFGQVAYLDGSCLELIEALKRYEFSLSQTNVGDCVQITKLQRSNAVAELANVGITFEAEVQILSRTVSGSVIVRCNNQNVGIGAAIARSILIKNLEL